MHAAACKSEIIVPDCWPILIDVASGENEMLVLCENLNGLVGAEADGSAGVHEGHGYESRNPEGELLLEFTEGMSLILANTWFWKNNY